MMFRVSEVLQNLQQLSNAPTISRERYQELFNKRCDERVRKLDISNVECNTRAEILQRIAQEVDFKLCGQYKVKGA